LGLFFGKSFPVVVHLPEKFLFPDVLTDGLVGFLGSEEKVLDLVGRELADLLGRQQERLSGQCGENPGDTYPTA